MFFGMQPEIQMNQAGNLSLWSLKKNPKNPKILESHPWIAERQRLLNFAKWAFQQRMPKKH
jgi:hypothetical protein